MDRRNSRLASFLALVATAAFAPAGGFKIQDQSTRAMGMIDAFVAGADDASSVYYNPAGLTRLPSREAIGNLYVAHGTVRYSGEEGNHSSDGRVYAVPSLYVGQPVSAEGRLALGIGVYSPFGLGSKWGDDIPAAPPNPPLDPGGRRLILAEIRLANVNPTVAYQLTDSLSLGVGVDYFRSEVATRRIKVYNPLLGIEGQVDLEAEGDGWGYNAGLQWRCGESLSVGLTYRSQVRVHYEGEADIHILDQSTGADTELDYPAIVAAGVAWQATGKLQLELAAEWTQWSTLDEQAISIEGQPTEVSSPDWRDSWTLMLGGEYRLSERWAVRAGYGYNQTPVPGDTADPSVPTGDTHAVSFGVGCNLGPRTTVDAACVLAYGTQRTLDNAVSPRGEYDALSTYFSVGLTCRF